MKLTLTFVLVLALAVLAAECKKDGKKNEKNDNNGSNGKGDDKGGKSGKGGKGDDNSSGASDQKDGKGGKGGKGGKAKESSNAESGSREDGHGKGGYGNKGSCNRNCLKNIADSLKIIERIAEKNSSLNDAIIAAFQAAKLDDDYLINNNGTIELNETAINVNFLVSIPQIAPILTQLGLCPKITERVNKILQNINDLNNNQTKRNYLAAHLYLADKPDFVRGTSAALRIDYANLIKDKHATEVLACFVAPADENEDERRHKGGKSKKSNSESGSREEKGKVKGNGSGNASGGKGKEQGKGGKSNEGGKGNKTG